MIGRTDNEDLDFLHGWLWDRTRALRKDLRQQLVERAEDITMFLDCFEQCARLLLISLHHMSRSSSEDYSHQQDLEQLGHTMLSLRERYIDNRRAKILSPNEAEFQAYGLLVASQTGDTKAEYEIQNMRHLFQNRRFQTALELYRLGKVIKDGKRTTLREAQLNWKRYWDLVKSSQVSYLMACAAELHFSSIRHGILRALYHVYRRKEKTEDVTLAWLLEVLAFDTKNQLREFCGLYGFSFGTSKDGDIFLDMESGPTIYPSDQPSELSPQVFSQILVESKRKDRLLSAVIKGMSVSEAMSRGFLVEESHLTGQIDGDSVEDDGEVGNSLFIRDNSTIKPTDYATVSGLSQDSSGQAMDPSSVLNPFANSFRPNGATAAGPAASPSFNNPFLANGVSAASKPHESPFSGSTGSTLFNTSTPAPSSFGVPSAVSGSSSTQAPGTPSTDRGIFAGSPTTRQTIQPGLFNVNKDTIRFSTGSPFGTPSGTPITTATSGTQVVQPTASAPSTFPFFNTPSAENKPNGVAAAFPTFPAVPLSGNGFSSVGQNSGFSFTPVQPTSSSEVAPQDALAKEAEQERKAQEEQRRIQEEQTRRKQEEQDRRAREEEERKARELQRKAQEERERRMTEERARIARQEQEQREREREQKRREEKERQEALQRQKESNLENLTNSVFLDPMEGLLGQFIEQQVRTLVRICAEEVEQERAEQLAKEHCERKRIERIRSYCLRWYNMVVKKKSRKRARNRRQWLKDNAEKLIAMEEEGLADPVIAAQVAIQRNEFKKPEAPTRASTHRIEKRPLSLKAQGKQPVSTVNCVSSKKKTVQSSQDTTSVLNGAIPTTFTGFKKSYAPIDRTETDYFKLRAMGIDPSKHRKRSFDSESEVEEVFENDRKRARTTTSSSSRRSPPPKATSIPQQSWAEEDDLIARYNAFKSTYRKTGTSSPSATPNKAKPGRGSKDINAVITNARAVLSNGAPAKDLSTNIHHEFRRSVPDLTSEPYGVNYANFGNHTSTLTAQDKPAYWGRVSRFVPRALYGKGADAIRDYWSQSRGTSSVGSSIADPEPLNLSSPIPAQHSYILPTHDVDAEHTEKDGDAEDEEEMSEQEEDMDELSGEDEDEDEEAEEEGEAAEDTQLYSEEDYDEEGYDEEEDGYEYNTQYEENAQLVSGHGATQDDAIELSD